jgi:hypothetical protein
MTRFDTPLLHLAEPAPRQANPTRVHHMDTVFLVTILAVVLGGAFLVIHLAGAQSSGGEGGPAQWFAGVADWTVGVFGPVAKYGMLFLASIVNSAVIVLLVTALRTLDRGMGRMTNRRLSRFGPVRKMQTLGHPRAARSTRVVRSRETENYLLSPVFR